MPLGSASVAESLVVSEDETILSLLRDISSSLTSIRNQNRGCGFQSATDGCHCRCQNGISNGESLTPEDVNAGRSSAARSTDTPVGSTHQSVSESLGETVGTIYVLYGKSSPLDETTLARFAQHYNGVLDRSDVLDRLNRLPPDDFRHQIPATKGHFLRQFMSESLPSGFTTESDIQLCLAELQRFEDFQIRLGRGHFWIRDYDSRGSYTQWDCANPPTVMLAKNDSMDRQCEIPASEWPPEWLTRHELRPIAPWRRIMYGYQVAIPGRSLMSLYSSCRGLSRMVDSNGIIQDPYFSDISQPASMHLHRRFHIRKLTDYRPDIHKKSGCLFQLTYPKNSTSRAEDIAQSVWHGGSLYPGGQHHSTEFQSITVRQQHYPGI